MLWMDVTYDVIVAWQGKEWKPTLVILRINRAATCVKWSPDGVECMHLGHIAVTIYTHACRAQVCCWQRRA